MPNRCLLAVLPMTLAAPLAAQEAPDCPAVAQIAPAGVTITEAASVPPGDEAPVAHCLVRGRMDERTGSDGQPYAIDFELRLPDDWSGRFLHQFNGGADGEVVPALGARDELPAGDGALARGFAVVSSNAGHDGDARPDRGLAGGTAFGLDFEARRDYGYDAVAALQPAATALTEAYYGRPIAYSYGLGGSNGGRHALVAASRMPEAFDGLYVAYPGFNLPRAALQHPWDVQSFLAVGETLPDAFRPEELALVADGIRAACDALDGLEDGLVLDVAACQSAFDPESLACAGGATGACLPPEKVAALMRIHGGPRNSAGEQLYSDWPWDTGIASGDWRFWKLESGVPPWNGLPLIAIMGGGALAQVFTTPPTQVEGDPDGLLAYLTAFDFDEDAPKISATTAEFPESAMEVMTPPDAEAPTLEAFEGAGGKLVVYHGTSDPAFSFNDTARWHETLLAGNPDATEFIRFYAVPGMPHGQGGTAADEFDLLTELVEWVEQGEPPGPVIATVRPDNEEAPEALRGAERKLCPWPQVARYASGDAASAQAFACEDPA